ncbi:MAG: cytochrome c oxidase accessory protein CcoG [Betaproteobacteria bacterium]|nr:cytochrome c oxidase accessory protein CcoG [Betaproteobacteria bacterium]
MSGKHRKSKKTIPIVADSDQPVSKALYEAHQKIYPRNTDGIYKNLRWLMIWVTQIIFYGVPWLTWGDRQAVLLDITTHRFYIFGLILYPQDLIYLVVILIISALALFLFTAVAGRLWCGFSCPQSVYTKIFLWMERTVEGDRVARLRLDKSSLTLQKLYKKTLKHLLWFGFSAWTGFTFIGYFTPIRDLTHNIVLFNLGPWETFWIFFYSFATYGNAGFMREQICKYMCPYARFQSAMFDNDTLIVTYDQERGEPRSGRSRKADAQQSTLGDCIDCSFCVQVCPVGIDIRNGLQYECISCGLCIDACNGIMDKMGYTRGLVRFSTENALKNHWSDKRILQQILRPRVLTYSGLLLALSAGLVYSLATRIPFKVDVIRDRGVMSRIAPGGKIENVYRLQITNASEHPETYHIKIEGIDGLSIASESQFKVDAATSRMVPISLQIDDGAIKSGTHPIQFKIAAEGVEQTISEQSIFYMSR